MHQIKQFFLIIKNREGGHYMLFVIYRMFVFQKIAKMVLYAPKITNEWQ